MGRRRRKSSRCGFRPLSVHRAHLPVITATARGVYSQETTDLLRRRLRHVSLPQRSDGRGPKLSPLLAWVEPDGALDMVHPAGAPRLSDTGRFPTMAGPDGFLATVLALAGVGRCASFSSWECVGRYGSGDGAGSGRRNWPAPEGHAVTRCSDCKDQHFPFFFFGRFLRSSG